MTAATTSTKDNGGKDVQRRHDILDAMSSKKPSWEDRQQFRKLLREKPAPFLELYGLVKITKESRMKEMSFPPIMEETVEYQWEQIRQEMGYSKAPAVEKLLIEHIELCWLNLYRAEIYHAKKLANNFTTEEGLYWGKRLSNCQRRFLKAVETLARVRKLTRGLPPVQVNIATDGGQQVNVAAGG